MKNATPNIQYLNLGNFHINIKSTRVNMKICVSAATYHVWMRHCNNNTVKHGKPNVKTMENPSEVLKYGFDCSFFFIFSAFPKQIIYFYISEKSRGFALYCTFSHQA